MATTWDLFRGDTSHWEDRYFFLEAIKKFGEPVLDVGCGTGRLLLDYLKQGIDIEGMDNSPEMLAICIGKSQSMGLDAGALKLYEAEMETMTLPRLYQTILVPSGSFQLLTGLDSAMSALQNFHRHLLPEGTLVMRIVHVWKTGEPLETDWLLSGEKSMDEGQTIVKRWSKAKFEPDKQWEHTWTRYEVEMEGRIVQKELHERSPATRWYTQEQLQDIAHQAGFETQFLKHGGWEPSKAQDTAWSLIGQKR
ncbi:MAG: class I SAM-dependent methyltransferase [Fimbriimonadia bacterium]|nr:class I SAM-dependent methyltransferase [Fimbriimonadia bacterium]